MYKSKYCICILILILFFSGCVRLKLPKFGYDFYDKNVVVGFKNCDFNIKKINNNISRQETINNLKKEIENYVRISDYSTGVDFNFEVSKFDLQYRVRSPKAPLVFLILLSGAIEIPFTLIRAPSYILVSVNYDIRKKDEVDVLHRSVTAKIRGSSSGWFFTRIIYRSILLSRMSGEINRVAAKVFIEDIKENILQHSTDISA